MTTTSPGPIAVLYEDDDLVVVAKAPGELVVPASGGGREACLHHRLEAARGERLWVVHRLDRDASGVVVFARRADAHRTLCRLFEARQVRKHYVAFVAGRLPAAEGRLEVALAPARRGKMRPACHPDERGARRAVTEYRVRRRWRREGDLISLVNLETTTGRRHQIRVHLRAAGAPILFDALYGRGIPPTTTAGAPCRRLALHARRLYLPRPLEGRGHDTSPGSASRPGRATGVLRVEAPLPPDLVELGRWLNATWTVEPVAPPP